MSTIKGGPYKPTHKNHPCVLWAEENEINYSWLSRHGLALCEEYTRRYGREHKSQEVIEACAEFANSAPDEFVQCMPEEFKGDDPIEAYRKYYRGAKASFATWTNREVPFWWSMK